MMRVFGCIALVVVVFCGAAWCAEEDESDFYIEAEASLASRYVWRGLVFNEEAVFQPSVTVGWRELSLNVWASMDTTDINEEGREFNEVDFTLDYTKELELLSLSLGATAYVYPDAAADTTTEVYVSATVSMPLNPTLTAYRDLDESEGLYVTLGLSHTFELSEGSELELSGVCGWGSDDNNDFFFDGIDDGMITDVALTAAVSTELADSLSLTTSLCWSALVDDDAREVSELENNLVLSIALGYSF